MKILELRAENIKNLKVVEIKPGDSAVILEGKNGAGKSAVLDSLFMALTGKKLEKPIREGEARAQVEVDLGDYRIKRVITAKGERLEVLSKEGAAFKSPQTLLDGILGELTFDPLKFSSMEDKARRQLLADLVGLNFATLDGKRIFAYNERTIKNRELKALETTLHGIQKPADGTPREEISLAEEIAKVEALEAKERAYEDYLRGVQGARDSIADNKRLIDEKARTIADLKERISVLEGEIKRLESENAEIIGNIEAAKAPELVSPDQITAARDGLRDIEQKNIVIRNAVKFDEALKNLETAKAAVDKLDKEIEEIDQDKQKQITAAKFPIEGLGITDEYVIYQGRPFSQLSTGQQWKVSTAIAMALNPKLKIILIREGSLLDQEGLKAIVELAKEKDYQLWIEKVSDSKGVGIYIEDGAIPGQNLKPEKPLPPEG